MKKILFVVLALMLLASITSCGDSSSPLNGNDCNSNPTSASESTPSLEPTLEPPQIAKISPGTYYRNRSDEFGVRSHIYFEGEIEGSFSFSGGWELFGTFMVSNNLVVCTIQEFSLGGDGFEPYEFGFDTLLFRIDDTNLIYESDYEDLSYMARKGDIFTK